MAAPNGARKKCLAPTSGLRRNPRDIPINIILNRKQDPCTLLPITPSERKAPVVHRGRNPLGRGVGEFRPAASKAREAAISLTLRNEKDLLGIWILHLIARLVPGYIHVSAVWIKGTQDIPGFSGDWLGGW